MNWKHFILIVLFPLFSCGDEEIICDASFRINTVYSPDTLEYYRVYEIGTDSTIFQDSNVFGNLLIVDDTYMNVIGRNGFSNLNIHYIPQNSNSHFVGVCIWSDNCHVYVPRVLDTIR